MSLTLTVFSGLPGTGKTTLASLAATQLRLPRVCLDEVVDIIPPHMSAHAHPYWDDMMQIVLGVAAMHLSHNLSVIIDAVFMGDDRMLASTLATQHGARFRPIHTFVSDEDIWCRRVEERRASAPPTEEPASWERIQIQRTHYQPWAAGSALFIDSLQPPTHNLAQIISYIND